MGRWIVVDPAFRTVLRDSHGKTLTRKQLSDRSVFLAAISAIPDYDPIYTYDRTVHVRMARLGGVGYYLRLARMVAAIFLVMILILVRTSLCWYGMHRLRICRPRMRAKVLWACRAFLDSTTAS